MASKKIQLYTDRDKTIEASPETSANCVILSDGNDLQKVLDNDLTTPTVVHEETNFKVGVGDVNVSSSVVDGEVGRMVIKGKTYQNILPEPSLRNSMTNGKSMQKLNEGYENVSVVDGVAKSAILKGQTLVNLCPSKVIDYVASSDWDGYHQLVQNSKQSFDQWRALQDLKPNTKYYISCYVETFEVVNNEGYCLNNPSVESIFGDSMIVNGVGRYQWLSTTKSELTDEIFMALRCQNAFARGAIKIRDIMIIEYQEGMEEWDIPYFEGMASCKMPILSTVGKNLFNYKNYNLKVNEGQNPQEIIVDEQGLSFNVDTASWKSLWYDLYLESGEKYTLSYNTNLLRCFIFKSKVNTYVSNELVADTTVTNATEDKIQKVTKTFTAPSTGFIRVRLVSEQKVGNHILQNFQIEKSSSVTTYEPHKSSILSLPEEVVLRSLPNGVRDTFNTRTGVYTQNIGERVINGTENWHLQEEYEDGALRFKLNVDEHKHLGASVINVRCDKMPVYSTYDSTYEKLSFCSQGLNCFQIIVPSNIALENGISNSTTFKSWLAQNYAPMTVCYQLTEPIVTKINLSSTLKSWNTTTHIYSEIPENTLYPTLSHSNPSYPVILKPSTKYSIVANSYSNDHTSSAINFNLGGATASTTVGNRVTTITTPSTLSNELLTMSGRGNKLNNVMVIEGDVAGDEPYFEGICDCKSPILSNCGKNLFDGKIELGGIGSNGIPYDSDVLQRSMNFTRVSPNTTYKISDTSAIDGFNIIEYDFNKNIIERNWIGNKPFTTKTNCHYIKWFNSKVDKERFAIIEQGSYPSPYEPYKSNILSANGDKIELTEDMFEQGGTITTVGVLYQNNKEPNNARLRLKDIVKVKPNTTYRLKLSDSYQGYVQTYNKEKLSTSNRLVWSNDIMFTTTSSEQYAVISIRYTNNSSISVGVLNSNIITLSEVDKTIVLRSLPDGTCDTLNVETGEYVQRIAQYTLTGNETNAWNISNNSSGEAVYFTVANIIPEVKGTDGLTGNLISDTFHNDNPYNVVRHERCIGAYQTHIRIKIPEIELSANSYKDYFRNNPTTIQYELATPIVTTIDVQGFPYAYKDGHVQLSSGSIEQSLTPKVEYSLVANRNGQIEANTKSIRRHQDKLDDFEALMLTQMIQTHYEKTLLQFDFEMQMMALGGE